MLIEAFVLPCGRRKSKGEQWEASRRRIDRMRGIVAEPAKDFEAVRVPMQEVFDAAAEAVSPEQWIWDGVHPLPQGHES